MPNKILITVGGTGGHLFPAQALAKELLENHPELDLLFVGDGLLDNPFFDKSSFVAKEVPSATFSFRKPAQMIAKGGKVARGIVSSCKIIERFSPDLVIGFGSFYSLPTLVAAKLKGVPFVLHEQNTIPGRVNRLLARFARFSGITFPETKEHLKGQTTLTQFPLRFQVARVTRETACETLSLDKGCLTLLILGGSQGASKINHLMFQTACLLEEALPPFQVIHLVGSKEDEKRSKTCWQRLGCLYYIRTFEPRMDLVMAATDLLIGRAGASTIAEQIDSETPGLLIPYPYATENHQERNARYFVDEIMGGKLLLEEEATPEELLSHLSALSKSLPKLKENIARYKSQRNLPHFWELIIKEIKQ